MIDKRFDKILTIILIIVIIGLCIAMGFWGYDYIQKYNINKGASTFLEEFDQKVQIIDPNSIAITNATVQEQNIVEENNETVQQGNPGGGSTPRGNGNQNTGVPLTYKGFNVLGKIEIPATKVNYPVLEKATESSMKVSVGVVYGSLNEPGNTVIMGHNYRNGALFSNNKKLNIGDVIYITDTTGRKITYTIYNKYTTASTDFDYAIRDTAGKREISLASCTDDSQSRLIIWAREQ